MTIDNGLKESFEEFKKRLNHYCISTDEIIYRLFEESCEVEILKLENKKLQARIDYLEER